LKINIMASEASLRKKQYDFDRFETGAVKEEEAKKPAIRRRSLDPSKRGNPARAVIAAFAAVGLLSLPVLSDAQYTELSRQITDQKAVLDELKSENVRLLTDIESKSAIKEVQSYATDILGMQKLDKSQVEYISTESGSEVVIPEYEPGFFTTLYNNFLDFIDYIKGE
jgi:hypothetical protein